MKIRWKRLFAWGLSAVLLGTAPGITLYAEETSGQTEDLSPGGLCEHHQEHDEDCGYQEEAGDASCTYLCPECNPPKTPEPTQTPKEEPVAPGQTQIPEGEPAAPGQAQTPEENTVAPGQAQTPEEEPAAPEQTPAENTITPEQIQTPAEEPAQNSPEPGDENPINPDSQQADTRNISSWSWVDEEELLTEGILILPQSNEEQPVSMEELLALLPKEILASMEDTEETIMLEGWDSSDYPEEGAWTGSFLFQALLPEEYVLAEEAKPLEIAVQFTDLADYGLRTLADEGELQDKSNGLIFETASYLPAEETAYKAGAGQITWKPTLENGKVVRGQLILRDAEIKDCTLGIQMPVHTEIILEGNNKITTVNRPEQSRVGLGISIRDSFDTSMGPLDLTVTGAGSLEIDSQGSGITTGGNLTVDQAGQLTIIYGSNSQGAHGISSTIADHTIAIRNNSHVTVKSRDGMTGSSNGAIRLQNSGDIIIEDSHVTAINRMGSAIHAGTNIRLTNSHVRAIGNTSDSAGTLSFNLFGEGFHLIIDGGTLFAQNLGSDYDIPYTTKYSQTKNSAVVYFAKTSSALLPTGDNIQYNNCIYDEASDTITKVGNANVFGNFTWNENIRFSPGTILRIGSSCSKNAVCTIPEGTTAEVPGQCKIDCTSTTSTQATGTLINNGTLHIQNKGGLYTLYNTGSQLGGTVQNHGHIRLLPGAELQNRSRLENSGTIDIEGTFSTVLLTGYDGTIANTGTINGFIIEMRDTHNTQTVYGNATLASKNLTLKAAGAGAKGIALQIPEGTKLTIEADAVVDARTNLTKDTLSQYLSMEGELVLEGELWLPEDTPEENLRTMAEHISGTGKIITGSGANESVWYKAAVSESGASVSGNGLYRAGDTVSISAGTRDGRRFKGWSVSEDVVLADASAPDTTFVMPEHSVTVTARWDILAERVELDQTALSLHPEDTAVLHVSFTPADASDQRVTWSSNHPEIAEVGADGRVTAKAPGTAIITVTALDGGLTARCMITVEKIQELPVPPEEKEETRLFLEEGIKDIPPALREKGLDTSEKIETALKLKISQNQSSFSGSNAILYDVTLMVRRQGSTQWEIADISNFPADGKLQVLLPYPEGTGRDTHDFLVAHMFTVAAFGRIPGDIELPAVTKTESGIRFEVTGLSPILLTWKEITDPGTNEPDNNSGNNGSGDTDSGSGNNGSGDHGGGSGSSSGGSSSSGSSSGSGNAAPASSQPLPAGAATKDPMHPGLWLITALFCSGCMILLLKKRRHAGKQTAL